MSIEMEVNVYRQDGSETGRKVMLDASVFAIEPSDHALWLDVRRMQANARQGTHKAKERSEVRGGGAKPWRQKGTGRARVGTIRSPLWKGGGTTFGPRPHAYTVSVNRKTRQLARRSALTYKALDGAVRVVESFSFDAPRTRDLVAVLEALGIAGGKVLLVTGDPDETLYKSGRNLPKVKVKAAGTLSTLDVLDAQTVLLQEGALEVLSRILGGSGASAAPSEALAVEEVTVDETHEDGPVPETETEVAEEDEA